MIGDYIIRPVVDSSRFGFDKYFPHFWLMKLSFNVQVVCGFQFSVLSFHTRSRVEWNYLSQNCNFISFFSSRIWLMLECTQRAYEWTKWNMRWQRMLENFERVEWTRKAIASQLIIRNRQWSANERARALLKSVSFSSAYDFLQRLKLSRLELRYGWASHAVQCNWSKLRKVNISNICSIDWY